MVKLSILITWIYIFAEIAIDLEGNSDIGCIPVAGLGIIADPQSFFPRLAQSIDFCIENFVLVKTQYVNLTEGIHHLKVSSNIKNLTIIEREKYIFSVSEGWNTVLKSFPNSTWFLILAYDVELRPGQLELMSRRFWDHSDSHRHTTSPLAVETPLLLAFSNYENADVAACAYNIFGMTSKVLIDIGYFDENLFPAFWEDTDWQYRFDRHYGWNTSRSKIYVDIKNWHGIHGSTKHITGTGYLEKVFANWAQVRHAGNVANKNYVRRKWGCSGGKVTIDTCVHSLPFANDKLSIGHWNKDVARIEGLRASIVPIAVHEPKMNANANTSVV